MASLNPLFEREWRGRVRHSSFYFQLATVVLLMSVLACGAIWHLGILPAMTPKQWQQNGHFALAIYRSIGALAFWGSGLFMGAISVANEKANGTWDDLLLCPMGGRGLSVGKIASGVAYLIFLQLILLLPLLFAAQCFGVTVLEIGSVMLFHALLTVQGVTLGFWGALRGRNFVEGLLRSLVTIGQFLIWGALVVLVAFLGFVVLETGLTRLASIPSLFPSINAVWPLLLTSFVLTGKTFISILGGLTGLGIVLRSNVLIGGLFLPAVLLLGQLLGIALVLKWSAWQVDYPMRDFGYAASKGQEGHLHNSHMRVLYTVWSWTLTPQQVGAFPLHQSVSEAEFYSLPAQLLARQQERGHPPLGNPTRRWRVPVAPFWTKLNPVLWLDLTRLFSARVSDSAMRPVFMIPFVAGGLFASCWSFGVVLGWIESARIGSAGDKVVLRHGLETMHSLLLLAALMCGPLWGTKGYVVERHSHILLELRLTLLSAWSVLWGKFVARFIAFVLCSLPLLLLVAFFAVNWPDKGGWNEASAVVLSTWLLATWSLLVCLCISDACQKELSAALGCGVFAIAWGVLMWEFPDFPWNFSHLTGVAIVGGYLFWRLKRLGFG